MRLAGLLIVLVLTGVATERLDTGLDDANECQDPKASTTASGDAPEPSYAGYAAAMDDAVRVYSRGATVVQTIRGFLSQDETAQFLAAGARSVAQRCNV